MPTAAHQHPEGQPPLPAEQKWATDSLAKSTPVTATALEIARKLTIQMLPSRLWLQICFPTDMTENRASGITLITGQLEGRCFPSRLHRMHLI
jgi:hypothetical protein